MNVSPQAQLLCSIVHTSPHALDVARVRMLDTAGWLALRNLADEHHLAPLVRRRLGQPDVRALVPAEQHAYLLLASTRTAQRNAMLYAVLAEILGAFRASGVEAIVLKGAHLAEVVYGDRGLRAMADLDIMIKPNQAVAAIVAMGSLGYRSSPRQANDLDYDAHVHLRPFVRDGDCTVELHRNLGYGSDLDARRWWERAVPMEVAGERALVLSAEDLLVHLAMHIGCQHAFEIELRQVCDITEVLRHHNGDLSWTRFVECAHETRSGRCVQLALLVAGRLVGATVPEQVLRALNPEFPDNALVGRIAEFVLEWRSHQAPATIRSVHGSEHIPTRLGIVWRAVFPSPRRMREMYQLDDSAVVLPLYYAYRPLDLLGRSAALLYRLAKKDAAAKAAIETSARGAEIQRWIARTQDR